MEQTGKAFWGIIEINLGSVYEPFSTSWTIGHTTRKDYDNHHIALRASQHDPFALRCRTYQAFDFDEVLRSIL